ncbi:hypothetical protein ACFL4T_08525 [candidate division KSB1 bacterium]
MRSIRYIFQSYFQKHIIETSILFISIGLFIIANIKTFETQNVSLYYEQKAWNLFLAALCFISGIMGLHLRSQITSSNTAMFPNFRRYQLITAGIILIIFLLWPVIITGIFGFPVSLSLAMMLLSVTMIFWSFFTGKILLFLALFPVWILFYELLGLQTGTKWFSWLPDLSGYTSNPIFPILIILFSGISLLTFILYYLKVSTHNLPRFRFEEYPIEETMNYEIRPERQGMFSEYYHKILDNSLLKLVQKKNEISVSVFSEARLIQFGLFGPGLVINLLWIIAPILWMLFFAYIDHFMEPIKVTMILPILFYIYLLGGLNIMSNFLRGSGILPELHLKSGLTSRNEFSRAIIVSILKTGFRYWIFISLIILISPLIFRDVTILMLPQVFVLGLIFIMLDIALSVLVTARSGGLLIITRVIFLSAVIIMIIPMRINFRFLFDNSISSWILVFWIGFLSLLLFFTAYTRWIQKELNLE